uniref:Uncharacterized protein n=1 Tax=Glossina morsitans morsitans TaxID=37546 RepID=A0A1B0GBT9_GLOMM
MVDYIWYARELGLGWVNTMTGQIRDDKIVRVETDSGEEVNVVTDNEDEVGFVGFDAGKELVTQGDRVAGEEETTDVQDIIEVKEQLAGVPYIEDRVDVQSPSSVMDEMHTRGPSTSAQARLIERLQAENKELKRRRTNVVGNVLKPITNSVAAQHRPKPNKMQARVQGQGSHAKQNQNPNVQAAANNMSSKSHNMDHDFSNKATNAEGVLELSADKRDMARNSGKRGHKRFAANTTAPNMESNGPTISQTNANSTHITAKVQ